MITLSRKESESILIHPSEDLDPAMTVAELFANGPIRVIVTAANRGHAQIGIEVPGKLRVIQTERFVPGSCPG